MRFQRVIFFIYLIFLASCGKQDSADSRFELLPPDVTGVDFVNDLIIDDSLNIMEFDYLYNGGGVAIGDFNNDSLPDIFFTGNKVSCRLYLNRGDMQFEDVTDAAGLTTTQWAEGVTVVDINQDGWMDIYISTSSGNVSEPTPNLLYINKGVDEKGIPLFSESASKYGVDDMGYNTQAAFFDYDKDGDLDLYILSNALETFNRNTTRPRQTTGKGNSTDKLYRNNGDGTFTNISAAAGILTEGYGLGIAISDINRDGWPDIYVANDFVTNDLLYINNGDGTYTNSIARTMKHQSHNGMGADIADFNNDGWTDVVVMDMLPDDNLRQKAMMIPFSNYDRYKLNLDMGYEPQYVRNTLQLNNGNDSFSEIGQLAGIHKKDWSWAPLFADFDNDGLKDLLVTNGYGKDITDLDYIVYSTSIRAFGTEEAKKAKLREEIERLPEIKIPNYLFHNNGDLTFSDKAEEWGLHHPSLSNGVAYSDLDNDGDLDLVINNVNDPAFVYRNNTVEKDSNGNYLKFSLEGKSPNRNGIGSKITLKYKKQGKSVIQYYEHFFTRGYKSTVENTVHFGLGEASHIDTLEVVWPDDRVQVLTNIQANQWIKLKHENSLPLPERAEATQLLFAEVSERTGIRYQHKADDFVDFKIQVLLPHKHSENGPGIAVGDVNGDKLDDFYVGGSAGYPGKLFIQAGSGKFNARVLPGDSVYDDMGAIFFDADDDGDLDLYVVSGGSRYGEGSAAYQDRLYKNDGAGNFVVDHEALPKMHISGSAVTAADYDRDGDLDLFVGGRLIPGNYPLPAKSYVLENTGGKFSDVTTEVCPELQKAGLVTAAVWTDFNNDHLVDLVVTGEWMPVTFLKQTMADGRIIFENVTEQVGMAQTTGWWNSIIPGDFDNDGDVDYIAGNLGLNSKYKVSQEEPVSLYAKDFDKNGSIDPIMFYYNQGENYPVHHRDVLLSQVVFMRHRFPRYADYGKTAFDDFFQDGELDNAYVLKSREFRTSYIENRGNGTFVCRQLPIEAQFSPACGLLSGDFNHDGNADLLIVGNSYASEMHTGRYDASIGNYLEGDGKGNFTAVSSRESGFFVDGNAKAMAGLTNSEGQTLVLVTQQNDSLRVFQPGQTSASLAIGLEPLDYKAEILLKDGRKRIEEYPYGSSYLSQSSRTLSVTTDVKAVTVFDYSGKSRHYDLSEETLAAGRNNNGEDK